MKYSPIHTRNYCFENLEFQSGLKKKLLIFAKNSQRLSDITLNLVFYSSQACEQIGKKKGYSHA